MELVVGNLNENGYLTASDEELVESLMQFRAPARSVPIPFERGAKGKLGYRFDPDAEESGRLRKKLWSLRPRLIRSGRDCWLSLRRRGGLSIIWIRWAWVRGICGSAC